MFYSIEIQRSTLEGGLKEVGTMFGVWLLDLTIIPIDSFCKKKMKKLKVLWRF
jgi:hypothetical protein